MAHTDPYTPEVGKPIPQEPEPQEPGPEGPEGGLTPVANEPSEEPENPSVGPSPVTGQTADDSQVSPGQ